MGGEGGGSMVFDHGTHLYPADEMHLRAGRPSLDLLMLHSHCHLKLPKQGLRLKSWITPQGSTLQGP